MFAGWATVVGEGRLEGELPKSLNKPLKKKKLLIRNYYFHPSSSLEIKELYLGTKSEMMKILQGKEERFSSSPFYHCYDDSLLLSTYMALDSFQGLYNP